MVLTALGELCAHVLSGQNQKQGSVYRRPAIYSDRVIQANLTEFARLNGWEPQPHSLDDIREFSAHIDSITEVQRNARSTKVSLTRELTKQHADSIRRFIENEQILCALDAGYWINNYAYICDARGEVIKFIPREGQRVFSQLLAQFEDNQISIELLILKARQIGITSATVMYFVHRLLFIPHTQAVMASVQQEKSELIQRMTSVCLDRLPWWLAPSRTRENQKLVAFDNGSVISIQSGSQATGIAQGWTPTCVHVSEIGDVPQPKKTIEEGLLRATHSSRKLFMVLEGTGNGNTGWQADTWRSAKEDYPNGRHRLCPIFIPWPMASDLYPEKDWLRKFPIPEDWQPKRDTRNHVLKCELYIRNTQYLSRIAGSNWKMPREQQWYWEFNFDQAVKNHTEKVWMSQMPADDREALVGKNDKVFPEETIEVISRERESNYSVYGIMSNAIDEALEPSDEEIDYDAPRIRVDWESHRGNRYDWQLVPLHKFDEADEYNSFGKILIFEPPRSGAVYTIGIDTAHGLGQKEEDRTVLSVARNVSGQDCDVQVAELTSNRINSAQLVGFAACLAAWYGEKTSDPKGVKFCVEQVRGPGDDCQFQLMLMGFNHFHGMVRYDRKKVLRQNDSWMRGWYTSSWSRAFLLGRFVDAVNGEWYKPNSLGLIEEIKNFERKFTPEGKEIMIAQANKKDDRLFAAALSYISRHDNDVLSERMQKKRYKPTGKLPQLTYEHATHNAMTVGEW